MELEFAPFIDILETVIKQRENDARERLVEGAFIGWQIQEQLKSFAEKARSQTFQQYLKSIGLDKQETPNNKEISKETALEIANSIVEADKKGG